MPRVARYAESSTICLRWHYMSVVAEVPVTVACLSVGEWPCDKLLYQPTSEDVTR